MAEMCNLGGTDRKLRIALGIAVGLTGILIDGHPMLGRALGIAGALLILTASWGTWLGYSVLGLSTRKQSPTVAPEPPPRENG